MPASINEPDKRKSGEGAMRGWQTRHLREISHDDICRLSRVFNAGADLGRTQDCRINEWLKLQIAARCKKEKRYASLDQ